MASPPPLPTCFPRLQAATRAPQVVLVPVLRLLLQLCEHSHTRADFVAGTVVHVLGAAGVGMGCDSHTELPHESRRPVLGDHGVSGAPGGLPDPDVQQWVSCIRQYACAC